VTWTPQVLYAGLSLDLTTELAADTYTQYNLTTAVTLESTRIPTGYLRTIKFPSATLAADCRLEWSISGANTLIWWRLIINRDGAMTTDATVFAEGGGGGDFSIKINTSGNLVVTRSGNSITSTTVINTGATSFDTFDIVLDLINGLLWLYDKTAGTWLGPVNVGIQESGSKISFVAGSFGELLGGGIGRGANWYALLAGLSSTSASDAPHVTALPDIAYVGQFPLADNAAPYDAWSIGAGGGAKASNWDDGRAGSATADDDTTYLVSPLSGLSQQHSTMETRATVGGIGATDTILGAGIRGRTKRGVVGKVAGTTNSLRATVDGSTIVTYNTGAVDSTRYYAQAALAAYAGVGSVLDGTSIGSVTGSTNDFAMRVTLLHAQWIYYSASLALAKIKSLVVPPRRSMRALLGR